MKTTKLEGIIEGLKVDVYPITIAKFLLNKKRIKNFFSVASRDGFDKIIDINVGDKDTCRDCIEAPHGTCNFHQTLERIKNATTVLYDEDYDLYMYKNEIIKIINENTIVVIYCPHPSYIKTRLSDPKVRLVIPHTVKNLNFKFQNLVPFKIKSIENLDLKVWFNHTFSMIVTPHDYNHSKWLLMPNSEDSYYTYETYHQ